MTDQDAVVYEIPSEIAPQMAPLQNGQVFELQGQIVIGDGIWYRVRRLESDVPYGFVKLPFRFRVKVELFFAERVASMAFASLPIGLFVSATEGCTRTNMVIPPLAAFGGWFVIYFLMNGWGFPGYRVWHPPEFPAAWNWSLFRSEMVNVAKVYGVLLAVTAFRFLSR